MHRWLLLAIVWLGVMAALASAPSPDEPSSGALANAVHAVQYAVLTIILLSFTRATLPRLPALASLTLAGAVAILVGVGQEWYQSFLPHRQADAADLAFDAVGVAGGLLLWTLVAVLWPRRPQRSLTAG